MSGSPTNPQCEGFHWQVASLGESGTTGNLLKSMCPPCSRSDIADRVVGEVVAEWTSSPARLAARAQASECSTSRLSVAGGSVRRPDENSRVQYRVLILVMDFFPSCPPQLHDVRVLDDGHIAVTALPPSACAAPLMHRCGACTPSDLVLNAMRQKLPTRGS